MQNQTNAKNTNAAATEIVSEWAVPGGWSGRGSLSSLISELDRQKASKIDFVADARSLEVRVVSGGKHDGGLMMVPRDAQTREFLPGEGVPIRPNALIQVGGRVSPEVPSGFLKTLASERPARAAELLNGLMQDSGRRNMVRMLDGSIRAFLSDRYRVIDNYDFAFSALEVARDQGAEVIECSISDTNMRLKLVNRKIFDVVDATRSGGSSSGWYAGGLGSPTYLSKVGARSWGELPGGPGTVYPAVTASNSETGHGGLSLRISILHGICFNLATVEDVVHRVHLGERLDAGIYNPETVAADNRAIMLKARDAIVAAFDEKKFRSIIAKCKSANEEKIDAPSSAVGNLVENARLSEDAKESILAHFLGEYRPTRYGLAQAVARYAQDVADGDSAFDVESLSGRVILEPALIAK